MTEGEHDGEGKRTVEPWLHQILRCPVTGAPLREGVGPDGGPELVSTDRENPLAYPIRSGVPVLLEGEARRPA